MNARSATDKTHKTAPTFDASVVAALAGLCSGDLADLAAGLKSVLPALEFERVLTRAGWCRFGGVVDARFARVADNIHAWVKRESGGDVLGLVERYADSGYFATRLQGRTHYLVAQTGSGSADFVQLEVEELQEVVDRPLVDPDQPPDDMEEFLDPLDRVRLPPQPIGSPRLVFRRITPVAGLMRERVELATERAPLQRFLRDWRDSSAAASGAFCRHWVLALRETPDSDGDVYVSAKPIPTRDDLTRPATPFEFASGADLANRIRSVDRLAGYPFAWYFAMLCSRRIAFETADAVYEDLRRGYDYLPACDAEVLKRWIEDRYAV